MKRPSRIFIGLILAALHGSLSRAQDVRLTNDSGGGYVSVYTLATSLPYSDDVLSECSTSQQRQNEPSVAVNPRDPRVLVGSSNDYCAVYVGSSPGNFVPTALIWLGYYRSENNGTSFVSSLVPGYPGDVSPYAALANIRTGQSGDPVVAWDNKGRLFMGSESHFDPAGTKKLFGDVWVARFDNPNGETGNTINDGKRFVGSTIVALGSSSPNTGKFNDKTAIEADRSGGACDGNVYFAWSRFTGVGVVEDFVGPGVSNLYFSRSTDHGATWSHAQLLTPSLSNVQFPEITVTGNGHVYVTFDQSSLINGQVTGVGIVKSTDCGMTFSQPSVVTPYVPYTAQDIHTPQPIPATASSLDDPVDGPVTINTSGAGTLANNCGDFADACQSGYTFFRRTTNTRCRADQSDTSHEFLYITFEASKPGTEVATGTSYGSIRPGLGSQSGVYFLRYDGATGESTTPKLIDDQSAGHQFFSAVSADGGKVFALWWDSRNDPSYSPMRPVGNDATGHTYPSLDVYAARSADQGGTWSSPVRLTAVTSNPNFEQYHNRAIPFAGDYLCVTSKGNFAFGVWTDWRNTVAGTDPREPGSSSGANVKQCRTFDSLSGTWGLDQCPHDGGINQDIYGSRIP